MSIGISGVKYDGPAKQSRYIEQLLAEIRETPGVRAASTTNWLPLASELVSGSCFAIGKEEPVNSATAPGSQFLIISPGYFDTMGTPLLSGRDFNERDTLKSPERGNREPGLRVKFFPEGRRARQTTGRVLDGAESSTDRGRRCRFAPNETEGRTRTGDLSREQPSAERRRDVCGARDGRSATGIALGARPPSIESIPTNPSPMSARWTTCSPTPRPMRDSRSCCS